MTNPSTSTNESAAGYQPTGVIASCDLIVSLKDGSEVFCSLPDGKATLFTKDENGRTVHKDYEHMQNVKEDLPQVFQELQRYFLNMRDFNGVDVPVSHNGLQRAEDNLGLLRGSDVASPAAITFETLDPHFSLSNGNHLGNPFVSSVEAADSIGPLTGYFERATPVGSQREEDMVEEVCSGEDAQESFSITAEANGLNLSWYDQFSYFEQATPVSPTYREELLSSFEKEASPNYKQERHEHQFPSSFEFHSSVTETERSLERDIDISLALDFESSLPDEVPDD